VSENGRGAALGDMHPDLRLRRAIDVNIPFEQGVVELKPRTDRGDRCIILRFWRHPSP
jgi:hypothetical protein